MANRVIELGNRSSMKAKIACCIMLLAVCVFCLIIGLWQTGEYHDLTGKCTAEVTGIIDEKSLCYVYELPSDPVETAYLTHGQQFRGRKSLLYADTRLMTHIDVQTDDLFKTKNIYADSRAEKVGDTVIIHYNPDDPTQYYFGNRVDEIRDTGVFCYAMAGAMFVLNLLFLRWIIFLYHSSKNKNTETTELTE